MAGSWPVMAASPPQHSPAAGRCACTLLAPDPPKPAWSGALAPLHCNRRGAPGHHRQLYTTGTPCSSYRVASRCCPAQPHTHTHQHRPVLTRDAGTPAAWVKVLLCCVHTMQGLAPSSLHGASRLNSEHTTASAAVLAAAAVPRTARQATADASLLSAVSRLAVTCF